MRWSSLGLAWVLGAGACLERRPTEPVHVDPAPAERAVSGETAPAGPPEPAPAPPPDEPASPPPAPAGPTAAQVHGRTVITSPLPIEALVPILARDVGPVARLGCDPRRVAWSTPAEGEHAREIHVVELP